MGSPSKRVRMARRLIVELGLPAARLHRFSPRLAVAEVPRMAEVTRMAEVPRMAAVTIRAAVTIQVVGDRRQDQAVRRGRLLDAS